jgi:hypothetical protein
MEYRTFFMDNKPIVPIICREVDSLPVELRGVQYAPYDLDLLVRALERISRAGE